MCKNKMNNGLIFEPIFKEEITEKRMGCINIDMDTMASDLTPGFHSIKDLRLADISWSLFVPRILKLFEKTGIKATFFIIGRHLQLASCQEHIKSIVESGHEIANHTMSHYKHFSLLSKAEIEREIRQCHDRLAEISGRAPVGFRAPGYTINKNIIEILQAIGYKYDASLNISKFHNILKAFYKFLIVKEKNFFVLQNLKGLPRQQKVYWVISKPSSERKYPLILFPINIVPFVHYAFISGSLIDFGYNITQLAYKIMYKKVDVLNFELHDFEFSTISDLKDGETKMPYLSRHYASIPMEKREKYFIDVFKLFQNNFGLVTFSEIVKEIYHTHEN